MYSPITLLGTPAHLVIHDLIISNQPLCGSSAMRKIFKYISLRLKYIRTTIFYCCCQAPVMKYLIKMAVSLQQRDLANMSCFLDGCV